MSTKERGKSEQKLRVCEEERCMWTALPDTELGECTPMCRVAMLEEYNDLKVQREESTHGTLGAHRKKYMDKHGLCK